MVGRNKRRIGHSKCIGYDDVICNDVVCNNDFCNNVVHNNVVYNDNVATPQAFMSDGALACLKT